MEQKNTVKSPALRPVEFGFFIAGCFLSLLLLLELLLEIFFTLHLSARFFLVLASYLSYYIAAYLVANRTGQIKRLRGLQIALFVIYFLSLIDLTLIGSSVGRLHFPGTREDYIELYINFRPFRTVRNYMNGYFSIWRIIANLWGNFFLLSPLAFFLPLLFRLERKWYCYLPTILLVACGIEALQFLFMAGSCDIDDVILNFLGATMLFFLLKIPPLRRLIRTITKSGF